MARDGTVSVKGLVLAGIAQFKDELADSRLFDPRLQQRVVLVCDIAHGMELGLKQAISLSASSIANQKLVRELKLLGALFEEIACDTSAADGASSYCYGATDVMYALEAGAVGSLLVWDRLPTYRHALKVPAATASFIAFSAQATPTASLMHAHGATACEGSELLLDFLVDHHARYGSSLELVSDQSALGSQFVQGFGGIAALLRYIRCCLNCVALTSGRATEEFSAESEF